MKRILITAALLGLAVAAAASSALAKSTVVTGCPSTARLVANVTNVATNDPILGASGNVWAIGSYTRQLLVYRVDAATYCVMWRDSGSFTTIAGPSPGGLGLVAGGIKGKMARTSISLNFKATLLGNRPTSGSLGTGESPIDFLAYYFENVPNFGVAYESGLFSSAYGCWSYKTGVPTYGDVATSKA
jgi:hypothetical protein